MLAVNDVFVCYICCCLPLQFYGGAAQDFGAARPLWESYGWSIFKLQDPPAAANLDNVKIQVRNSITITVSNCCVAPCGLSISCSLLPDLIIPSAWPALLAGSSVLNLAGAAASTHSQSIPAAAVQTHTYIHSYIHTYIHTYIDIYIHTHTYLDTYIHTPCMYVGI